MTEEEALQTTKLPLKHWTYYFRASPSGLVRLENSLFSEWNGSFLFGSLFLQHLVSYNMETDETSILLDGVGRVRDIAQLPSGNLLILIDADSPRFYNSGRVVKLSPNN